MIEMTKRFLLGGMMLAAGCTSSGKLSQALSGRLKDTTGQKTLHVISTQKGMPTQAKKVTPNANGKFKIPPLAPGVHQVKVADPMTGIKKPMVFATMMGPATTLAVSDKGSLPMGASDASEFDLGDVDETADQAQPANDPLQSWDFDGDGTADLDDADLDGDGSQDTGGDYDFDNDGVPDSNEDFAYDEGSL